MGTGQTRVVRTPWEHPCQEEPLRVPFLRGLLIPAGSLSWRSGHYRGSVMVTLPVWRRHRLVPGGFFSSWTAGSSLELPRSNQVGWCLLTRRAEAKRRRRSLDKHQGRSPCSVSGHLHAPKRTGGFKDRSSARNGHILGRSWSEALAQVAFLNRCQLVLVAARVWEER